MLPFKLANETLTPEWGIFHRLNKRAVFARIMRRQLR
jgi:hypothetical protein